MSSRSVKTKTSRCAAAVTATLSVGSLLLSSPPAAHADPQGFLVGVGSDTTQDVLNALSGFNNGISYAPLRSSSGSGSKQLASFDATPAGSCITPRSPGATFNRPNGSTAGRQALSRSIDGGLYGSAGACGAGGKVISGLVDFARSSAGPSGSGTALTYLPFGRDAVSFGYYASSGAPVTTLTSAQLTSLYSTGPQNIGGVNIIPCLPQVGSGTRAFWLTAIGVPSGTADTATAACNGPIQENDGNALKAKGDSLSGNQVIIPFSAANFIAQSNGVAASQLNNAAGVDLGSIDALGKPVTGTAPSLAPSGAFYSSPRYGRDVYNVVAAARLGGPPTVNADVKTLFLGPSSAICSSQPQTTVNAFGFLSLGAGCGSTGLTGPLVA